MARTMLDDHRTLRRELMTMPNIGPAMADDLVRLKIKSISDLRNKDPIKLYNQLARLDGVVHDPCVLDTLMAAVDFARTGNERAWWEFTAERKAMMSEKGERGKKREGSLSRRRMSAETKKKTGQNASTKTGTASNKSAATAKTSSGKKTSA